MSLRPLKMPKAISPARSRLLLGFAALVGLLAVYAGLTPAEVSAQPPLPIIYGGTATIAGNLAPDGTMITARVGGGREGRPVAVQNGKFSFLVADPSFDFVNQAAAVGEIIEFFANGARALETDIYREGSFIEKTKDLNFPELPQTGDDAFASLWTLLGLMGASSLLLGIFMLGVLPRLLPPPR